MAQLWHRKGICDACGMPVFEHQARSKDQQGAYVHAHCVAGAGDERVGVAVVAPPIAPKPQLKDVKGICDVCRTPVFGDQARCKNQWGAYVHAHCVAGAGDERVGVAGMAPPIAPKPELEDVKGICDVCRTPVFEHQARCKNQRGAYVHAHCVPGANLPKPYHQTAPDSAQPQHLQQHHVLFRDAAERPLDVLPQQIEQARQQSNALLSERAESARLLVELQQAQEQINVLTQNAALKKDLEKATTSPQVQVQILTAQLAETNAQGAMLESELHKLQAKLAAAEAQPADLQEHFNTLLQGERAESVRLALELQHADLQQQQIEQAWQQSNALLQDEKAESARLLVQLQQAQEQINVLTQELEEKAAQTVRPSVELEQATSIDVLQQDSRSSSLPPLRPSPITGMPSKHASYALNELGSALREATINELPSEFKHLNENLQSSQTKTLAHDDAVHLVRMAIVADPEGFFERVVADSMDDSISRENFENMFAKECSASVGEVSESAKRLFDQLDTNKDEKISLPELTQMTNMIRHFWKESECESVITAVLMGLVQDVQSKRESSAVSSDVDRVREQTLKDLAGLQEDDLRSAMTDKVAKAVAKHAAAVNKTLESLQKHGDQQEDQCDSKFGLDTATYGSISEYHRGLSVVGAPHPNILHHMQMEAKESPDSLDPFEAWNSGKNTTTAQKEWDFVCDPYKSVSQNKSPSEWEQKHEYGGNRWPIRLQVFMHALSATPMSDQMGASLFEKGKTFFGDYEKAAEYAETDPRWLHVEEVSMVKVLLLRLTVSQLDGVSLINALDKVKHLSGKYSAEQANIKAYDIVKALDEAFHKKTEILHSKCTLALVKALKEGITTRVARGPSGLTPVQARVLEHLHEVVQKMNSIELPGHKQWLAKIEENKLHSDCTFDLLVDLFKDIATKEEIKKKLDKVLHDKDGPHSTCTFKFLVSELTGIASEEELEAIMRHFHTKVAKAKMSEAEVIGQREYSGPLYVKINASLRVVGAHVKMVIIMHCAVKQCTLDVKETLKEVVAAVANVAPEVVSIDSVSRLQTGTRIEFRVGVAPERNKADLVRELLTESAINGGLAAKNMSSISLVEAACVVALPEHLKGNRYVNTIFAIASGMCKMAQVSRIPRGRLVFRGAGGVKLPGKFFIEKEGGGRGGVDYAFTSTTTKKEVAISYVQGKEMPVLFKIETGDIDRGCTLSWVSQYPSEDELLMPAMSYLEITGKATVEETPKGSGLLVTVYPARINCNTKSQTIEELVSQRKDKVLASLEHQVLLAARSVTLMLHNFIQDKGLKETDLLVERVRKVEVLLAGECEEVLQRYRDMEAEDLNNDEHMHQLALQEVATLPAAAAAKFAALCQNQSVTHAIDDVMSMELWAALVVSNKWHAYHEEATRNEVDKVGLREAAVGLAEARGLVSMGKGGLDATSGADKRTPLMSAVVNGNVLDLQLLLDASCSIDVADFKGRTPLACAMIFGRHDMAQHLLLRGASPKATTLRGETTVFLASRFGHTAPLEKVRSHLGRHAPDQQAFKSLIMQQEQTNGRSCLFSAACFGHLDVAQLLVKEGGRDLLFLTDNDGLSCLYMAAQNGHLAIVELLVKEGGCDLLFLTDDENTSCLYMAAQNGHLAVVELLVKEGGRDLLFLTDNIGRSCLYTAACYGNLAVVELLLKHGGKDLLMLKRNNGPSCLYWPAREGHSEVVRVLEEACKDYGLSGSDIDALKE